MYIMVWKATEGGPYHSRVCENKVDMIEYLSHRSAYDYPDFTIWMEVGYKTTIQSTKQEMVQYVIDRLR